MHPGRPALEICLAGCLAATGVLNAQLAKPPVAPVKTVVDSYFGQKVDDPYR